MSVLDKFSLDGRVAIITGAAGLLGRKHAETIAELGGSLALLDVNRESVEELAESITKKYEVQALAYCCDISSQEELEATRDQILEAQSTIDILINNAANNPKVEGDPRWSAFENFDISNWDADIRVGLTGAFLCSKIFGTVMAEQRTGVIINIASDLAVIAPDQRIYRKKGEPIEQSFIKPVTYSVVKTALLGLTRYLSTYWADRGVRSNSISPGGVFNGQDAEFVENVSKLIPMGRMANVDEYQAAVAFLVSDASSYMNGANLVVDGGRSVW